MKMIKTATLMTNYADDGPSDAPVIVFSNSLGANISMWQPQIEHFSADFRLIRYDQRGHGGTEVTPGPYSFDILCTDVIALLDALNIERAHFVGLSMGGMTALGLAIEHPDRLLSITSANCVAGFGPDGVKVWDERITAVTSHGLEPILDGTLQRWFTQATITARPDDMLAVRNMILATPVDGYIACCGALKTLNYVDRLATIAVPTLFIAGSHDLGAPASAVQDMHDRVADSQYIELDTAHVSNMERPQDFNRAIDEFIKSI